jgi:hypothetical protein
MRAASEHAPLEKRLEGAGWGLLFIWVGISLAIHVGWGVALIGVGLVMLGVQATRKLLGLPWDRFALMVGGVLVAGGIWEGVNGSVELVPLLSIGVGAVLLVSALTGRARRPRRDADPGAAATHRPA